MATRKETIRYTPGELHAVQLDDNTVALVLPTDYAATIRDVMYWCCTGTFNSSRRKYTDMISRSLNGLKDFPAFNRDDIASGSNVSFKDNEAVK